MPRSPRTALLRNLRYWTGTGSSSPHFARMIRAAAGSTDATFSSIKSATGSPGTICISTNVTRVTPTKTGSASSNRRAMNLKMPLAIEAYGHDIRSSPRLDPDLVHLNPIQLQRVPANPVHVRLVPQRGFVIVPKEPRRIRDDQPLCLLAELDLPARVEGALRFVHQRIDPVILVEHAIAREAEVTGPERTQVVHAVRAAAVGQHVGHELALARALQHDAEVLLDDARPDAGVGQVALQHLQPPTGHGRARAVQVHLEAAGESGLGEEFPCPLRIVLIAAQAWIEGGEARREDAGGHERLVLQHGADGRRLVDREVDGLADADVVQRRFGCVHSHVAGGELRDPDDGGVSLRIPFLAPVRGGFAEDEVQIPPFEFCLEPGGGRGCAETP